MTNANMIDTNVAKIFAQIEEKEKKPIEDVVNMFFKAWSMYSDEEIKQGRDKHGLGKRIPFVGDEWWDHLYINGITVGLVPWDNHQDGSRSPANYVAFMSGSGNLYSFNHAYLNNEEHAVFYSFFIEMYRFIKKEGAGYTVPLSAEPLFEALWNWMQNIDIYHIDEYHDIF